MLTRRKAADYESRVAPRYRVIAEGLRARAHIVPRERVLEVGAGTGLLTRLLLADGVDVIMSDISGAMLLEGHDSIRREGFPVPFTLLASVDKLPFRSASFDVVTSNLTPLQDSAAAVSEAFRVLRPEGKIAVAMWGPSYSEMRINNVARRLAGKGSAPYGGPRLAVTRLRRRGFQVSRDDRHFEVEHADAEAYLKYRRAFGCPPGWTDTAWETYLRALKGVLSQRFGNGRILLDWNVTYLIARRD